MLLMDNIVNMADILRRHDIRQEGDLYIEVADKLLASPIPPRFIFDEKAILTATELTLGRPKVLRDIMRYIYIPYPVMWIEWEERGREILRQKFPQDKILEALRPVPQRFGFLLEAFPGTSQGLRTGKITWVWDGKANEHEKKMGMPDEIPNVSAITTYFDLDRDDFSIDKIIHYPLRIAESWADNKIQYDALHDIWRTAYHEPSANGRLLLDYAKHSQAFSRITRVPPHQAEDFAYADVVGEYIMVWTCLLLLTAKKPCVSYNPVDLTRLNKTRQKYKKTPLLDHQIVHISLPTAAAKTGAGNGRSLDYRRKSPRIHLVSSYLYRRGSEYGIVLPYVRGSGDGTTRKTYIHG